MKPLDTLCIELKSKFRRHVAAWSSRMHLRNTAYIQVHCCGVWGASACGCRTRGQRKMCLAHTLIIIIQIRRRMGQTRKYVTITIINAWAQLISVTQNVCNNWFKKRKWSSLKGVKWVNHMAFPAMFPFNKKCWVPNRLFDPSNGMPCGVMYGAISAKQECIKCRF